MVKLKVGGSGKKMMKKKKPRSSVKEKNLQDLSVEEFMLGDFSDESSEDDVKNEENEVGGNGEVEEKENDLGEVKNRSQHDENENEKEESDGGGDDETEVEENEKEESDGGGDDETEVEENDEETEAEANDDQETEVEANDDEETEAEANDDEETEAEAIDEETEAEANDDETEAEANDDDETEVEANDDDETEAEENDKEIKVEENDDEETEVEESDDDEEAEVEESDDDEREEAKIKNLTEEEERDVGQPKGGKKKKSVTATHKKSLTNLKKTDPEFYKFLQENDKKLLNFDDSESEDEEKAAEEQIHVPPESLEVASDDSDYEEEKKVDAKTETNHVSMAMIKKWEQALVKDKTFQTLHEVIEAFHAAVMHTVSDEADEPCKYKVVDSTVFNGIVRLCILDLHATLQRILRLPKGNKYVDPTKSKAWVKLKKPIKMYLLDFVKLLSVVVSENIVTVLLKHVHHLVIFYPTFPKAAKALIKRLIAFWCTGEEAVRVLSFLSIVRITRRVQGELLEPVLKQMYMSYLRNVKFTSPLMWPMINFMRRSLVEMFALSETVAYHYTFVYIRQLAISLRTAIILMKEEAIKSVYNWQYVHSLHLWAGVLAALQSSNMMQSLIYPLIQVIIGAIRLSPITKYYPLRFHLIRMLIFLSAETEVFIPVMPFLLEILGSYKFNTPHSKMSLKPMDFSCVLKVSKTQMHENAFKDGLIDQIYELFMEYLSTQAHTIGFPELVLPAVMQLKVFLEKCKVANYCRKMKQLLDKINENSKEIEARRKNVTFALSDLKSVKVWESQCRAKQTPFGTYYSTWKHLHETEVAKKINKKEVIEDYNFPIINKKKKKQLIEEEFQNIFASDESENEDDKLRFMLKEERAALKRKKEDEEKEDTPKKMKVMNSVEEGKMNNVEEEVKTEPVKVENSAEMDTEDIVEDLNMSDFESEGESEEDGSGDEEVEDESMDDDEVGEEESDDSDLEENSNDSEENEHTHSTRIMKRKPKVHTVRS